MLLWNSQLFESDWRRWQLHDEQSKHDIILSGFLAGKVQTRRRSMDATKASMADSY